MAVQLKLSLTSVRVRLGDENFVFTSFCAINKTGTQVVSLCEAITSFKITFILCSSVMEYTWKEFRASDKLKW